MTIAHIDSPFAFVEPIQVDVAIWFWRPRYFSLFRDSPFAPSLRST
jgi:hypothetical protein